MKKIVVNRCHGGFGLSDKAEDLYAKKAGFELFRYHQTKYRHSEGAEEYSRVTSGETSFCTFTFKEDHGDSFSEFPEDGGYWSSRDIKRDDSLLIEVVQELGSDANGSYAQLEIVEIPDDVEWQIDEYDGSEWVSEKHRTW